MVGMVEQNEAAVEDSLSLLSDDFSAFSVVDLPDLDDDVETFTVASSVSSSVGTEGEVNGEDIRAALARRDWDEYFRLSSGCSGRRQLERMLGTQPKSSGNDNDDEIREGAPPGKEEGGYHSDGRNKGVIEAAERCDDDEKSWTDVRNPLPVEDSGDDSTNTVPPGRHILESARGGNTPAPMPGLPSTDHGPTEPGVPLMSASNKRVPPKSASDENYPQLTSCRAGEIVKAPTVEGQQRQGHNHRSPPPHGRRGRSLIQFSIQAVRNRRDRRRGANRLASSSPCNNAPRIFCSGCGSPLCHTVCFRCNNTGISEHDGIGAGSTSGKAISSTPTYRLPAAAARVRTLDPVKEVDSDSEGRGRKANGKGIRSAQPRGIQAAAARGQTLDSVEKEVDSDSEGRGQQQETMPKSSSFPPLATDSARTDNSSATTLRYPHILSED